MTSSKAVFRLLQLLLVLAAFGLDFAHGFNLGENDIAFHPIYRVRQAVAVAISRMHQPPLGGYLAYQSVIDTLTENGFAVFNDDKGPPPDEKTWHALFADPARSDRALEQAKDTAVDPKLPPQLIEGNEPAYADYMYDAFSLFGLHFSSLYYFYFLLLGGGCVLFLIEFWRSPFLTFLLTGYLAGLFFLQNYAQSWGDQLATIANSRMFDALSLLPAMHILLAMWKRLPLKWLTLATVAGQSALLAFVVDCHTAGLWQIAMIVTAGALVTIGAVRAGQRCGAPWLKTSLSAWPVAVAVIVLALQMGLIKYEADPRYAAQTESHVIWHEVLRGMLASSLQLQRIYLGKEMGLGYDTDQISYDAVMNDLNDRNDKSSPVAFTSNGRIYIDLQRSYSAYEKLARSLAVRILVAHPFDVLGGLGEKFDEQLLDFANRGSMAPPKIISAIIMAALAGVLWLAAGAWELSNRDVRSGLGLTCLVLIFAAAPVAIVPSEFLVGGLLSFMIAATVGVFTLVALSIKALIEDVAPSRATAAPSA